MESKRIVEAKKEVESKKRRDKMKIGKLLMTGATVLVLWIIYYFGCPTFSLGHFDGVFFIGLCIISLISLIVMFGSQDDEYTKFGVTFAIGGGIWCVIVIIGVISSLALFRAETMRAQLGTPEEIEFDDMIHQIDISQIPIVDEALAKKQAEKKLGEDVSLGSRVILGDAAIQEVDGEIMWVIPLKHSDPIKWYKFRTLPGYITVSASNPNKVTFVKMLGDEDIQIAYSDSSCFENNLKRKIRNEGYTNVGLTEYTFEINDEGRPFWVVTTYNNKTVWSNGEATGVVIVDAQTGETTFHGLNDIPEWVDIVQPRDFVEKQIDNWGKLVHGVWNWSDQDKIKKTDLMLTVYVDGDCYYFSGITSVGKDESCSGFIMVNTRTKKSQMCKSYGGATESAAMKSAEGLVSDFGYTATEPLPLNLNGIPTYVLALKDAEGLIKNYAMVNIENYLISAKGASLQEASRAYMQAVSKSGSTNVVGADEAYGYDFEGIVERISTVVEGGSTYYYMILNGQPDKIFMASYTVSEELPITRDGDTVKIHYIDDSNGIVDIVSFENIAFAIQVSDMQEKRNELDEGTSSLDSDKNQIIDVNPEVNEDILNSMSDEEKSKMIEEYLKQQSN